MDLKWLPLSDQLPYSSTPRKRKVVSRLVLGMVISSILLIGVCYYVSSRAPFLQSVWKGFNGNSSSLFFWSFSFPASSCFSSSCSNATSAHEATLEKLELSAVRDESHENVFKNGENRNFMDSNGKVVLPENASVGNSSEIGKNGNFSLEGGMVPGTSLEFNGSGIDKNATLSNAIGQEKVLEDPRKENISKNVRDGNVSADGKSLSTNVSDANSKHVGTPDSFYGDCDFFQGRWVKDHSKPYYPPGSCPYIDRDFDCHLNKRPDSDYVNWRWQPHGCDIPSLNATDFLERLRGQKLVFVGDSLNRNMWESLVCILRHNVADQKRVYEISGRTDFKKKGFYAFRFEDYNCTVDFVNSPFLVKESLFNGVNGSFETLRLDLMDETTFMYQDADILIFNTAHWWTHEKTSRGEDYYQEGNHVHRRLKVLEAYKRALFTWARWVDKHINNGRTQVFFRGYSAVHFSGGQWNSGGQCHKETEPIFNNSHLANYPRKMKALEYVLQDMKTPVIYLNISMLTEYRKDAHPSIYRKEYKTTEEQIAGEQAQDCSHWCLPGVPDIWNELLYASLLKDAHTG